MYPTKNLKKKKEQTFKEAIGDTVSDNARNFVMKKHNGAIKLLEDD